MVKARPALAGFEDGRKGHEPRNVGVLGSKWKRLENRLSPRREGRIKKAAVPAPGF